MKVKHALPAETDPFEGPPSVVLLLLPAEEVSVPPKDGRPKTCVAAWVPRTELPRGAKIG